MNDYVYRLFLPGGLEEIIGYKRPVELFYRLLKDPQLDRETLIRIADDLRYGDTTSLEEL